MVPSSLPSNTGAEPPESIVEVWENEKWSRKRNGWVPTVPSRWPPWSTKGGEPMDAPEDIKPPADFTWASNWRVEVPTDSGQIEERDPEGWEYATAVERFGDTRVPRGTERWRDRARRRRWMRIARRHQPPLNVPSICTKDKRSMIQDGLRSMERGRKMIGEMMKLVGSRRDSVELRSQVDQLVMLVRQHGRDVDSLLKAADRESLPAAKKLSNDLARQQKLFDDLAQECDRRIREVPLPDRRRKSHDDVNKGGGAVEATSDAVPREGRAVSAGKSAFRPLVGEAGGAAHGDGTYVSKEAQSDLILEQMTFEDEDIVMDSIVRERGEVIEQIAKNVLELREIFSDFAKLVKEQQAGIDEIERNTISANIRAEEGLNSIMRAHDLQRDATCVVS